MQPVLAAICCFVTYFLVYRFYARYLGARIFRLDPTVRTPAHVINDGIDYVPSKKGVLFGHHYASIAGLAPMLGPAIAVIWGWLPGMLWVVLGTLFIGAVHDFGALVVSMRHRGMSIGKVAEDLIGHRAKSIFLMIILFLICLVMGVFVRTVAVWHITWFVNSAAHTWGYRNYETRDNSRNNWLAAILSNGDGWHNNHHAIPRAADHGQRWFEFDVAYLTIRCLGLVGLATNIVTSGGPVSAHRG